MIKSWVAQWVRASSWHTKVVGLIPGQDTYKKQPVSAWISGTTKLMSLSNINKINQKLKFKYEI